MHCLITLHLPENIFFPLWETVCTPSSAAWRVFVMCHCDWHGYLRGRRLVLWLVEKIIDHDTIQLFSTSLSHFSIMSCENIEKKPADCPSHRWFVPVEHIDFYVNSSRSESKLGFYSFYWCVQVSWIISESVGFRTDTELSFSTVCYLWCSPPLSSTLQVQAISLAGCALPQRQVKPVIVFQPGFDDGWLVWLLNMIPTHQRCLGELSMDTLYSLLGLVSIVH